MHKTLDHDTTYYFHVTDETRFFGLFDKKQSGIISKIVSSFHPYIFAYQSPPFGLTEKWTEVMYRYGLSESQHNHSNSHRYLISRDNPWHAYSQRNLSDDFPSVLTGNVASSETICMRGWHKEGVYSRGDLDLFIGTTLFPQTGRSCTALTSYDKGPNFFKRLARCTSNTQRDDLMIHFHHENADRLHRFILEARKIGLLVSMAETPQQLAGCTATGTRPLFNN